MRVISAPVLASQDAREGPATPAPTMRTFNGSMMIEIEVYSCFVKIYHIRMGRLDVYMVEWPSH